MKNQKNLKEQSKQKFIKLTKTQLQHVVGGTETDGMGEGSEPDPK